MTPSMVKGRRASQLPPSYDDDDTEAVDRASDSPSTTKSEHRLSSPPPICTHYKRSTTSSLSTSTFPTEYDITELATKRRKLLEEKAKSRKRANTDKVVSELQALVDRAKNLEGLNDDLVACFTPIAASLETALEHAEDHQMLCKYIASFRRRYPSIDFSGLTESHLCDLVWVYQSLDKQGGPMPTFQMILSYVERISHEGPAHLAKRWTTAIFESFKAKPVRVSAFGW